MEFLSFTLRSEFKSITFDDEKWNEFIEKISNTDLSFHTVYDEFSNILPEHAYYGLHLICQERRIIKCLTQSLKKNKIPDGMFKPRVCDNYKCTVCESSNTEKLLIHNYEDRICSGIICYDCYLHSPKKDGETWCYNCTSSLGENRYQTI